MTTTASSPGNLFLCGEHAVVYGYPAIICSVEQRTAVTVTRTDNPSIEVTSAEFGTARAKIEERDIMVTTPNDELAIFLDLVRSLGLPSGFTASITSSIPVQSGMSSSTAVLASFLYALRNEFSLPIEPSSFYDLLLPLQKKVHGGKASGSEIFSSTLGGFHRIERRDDVVESHKLCEHDLDIVIADTRVHAPTSLTVGYHVPSLIDRRRDLVFETFDRIRDITNEAQKALQDGDAQKLGKLINENHHMLQRLGLSHPKLDDCVGEALDAGALGAKLSGSGWGGIMFALVDDEHAEDVKAALERTRATVIATSIGGEGTRVEEHI